MYPYKYCVALRIWHPTINPDSITQKMGLQPEFKCAVGEPRSTPKGETLKGINKETYWTANLHKGKNLGSREIALEDYLTDQVSKLKKSEGYFRHIRKTGGRIEFFVGLFCNKNMGAELPSSLLAGMGKLGIDLSLDIYPK